MKLNELVGKMTEEETVLTEKYLKVTTALHNHIDETWTGVKLDGSRYLKITNKDWNKAFIYSTARKISNMRSSTYDKYRGSNKLVGEILGVLNEIKCCQHYDVPFDDTIGARRGGEDAIVKGSKVDFKVCCPEGNDKEYVIVEQNKTLEDADVYFFSKFIVGPDKKKYIEMYCWLRNTEVIDDKHKVDWAPGYWIKKETTRPFKH